MEDGTECTDAFRHVIPTDSVEIIRAGDYAEATRALSEKRIDALFLDVVFDRLAPEKLAGDPSLGERRLAENQGFHLLGDLTPLLAPETPIVIAYDFSEEPERLAALRARHARLSGVPDGTAISAVFEGLTSGGTPDVLP